MRLRRTVATAMPRALAVFALLGALAGPSVPAAAAPCTISPCSFAYTGATQTWTVPAGVASVTITAVGAIGGSGHGGVGGRGASITGTFAVGGGGPIASGSTLTILVGGQGGGPVGNQGGGGGGVVGNISSVCSYLWAWMTRLAVIPI